MPPLTTEHPILVAIKEKGVNSLKQDITVFLQDDGKLKIEVKELKRTGNSGVQHNHVVPVTLFLSSIKYNLERQTNLSTLFNNLSYFYGLDNINYDKFKIVLDYYQQRLLSGTITRSNVETIKVVLQDYIVPLIYDNWDSRAGAIFKERKSRSELGQEGSKIKKLKKQFTTLYNNNKKVENFDTFKEEIQNFIQEYNKNIDLPNNLTPQELPKIIIDARYYLNILLNIINNSDQNSFLHGEYDGMTLLKPEVENWHKEVLKVNEFGVEFINKHPKIQQKQSFLNEWAAQLERNPSLLTSSDTGGTLTESDDNTDLVNSPIRNRGQRIEYDSNNIQQILLTSTGIKIGVILDTTTIAQRQNRQHIPGTDKLIERINLYIEKQKKDPQHYLVIDCTSSSLVDAAYLANLHYSNKHQFWKLDIRPLVNYYQVEQKEKVYLSNQLEDIETNIRGIPRYYDRNIKSARFEQIVEYAKLRINHLELNNSNFQQYKSKFDSITSSSLDSYMEQHYQESRPNTKSLLLSSPPLSSDSDTEFTPLESIDLTIGSDIITRSKSHPSQDLNNPQPSTSGVQKQVQKRGNLDVSAQSSLKKACTSKSSSRPKRATNACLFNWEDLDEISTRRAENIDELQIDNKRFLEYLKDSGDQAKNSQLLELVKIRQIENSDNIVGNYKYLLDQVIQDGGYNNYRQNERMQDIAYNLAKNDFSGISANLKNTIINAAGQIQLVRGTHGTIVACQTEGAERDCILSGLGLSYSFLSQPIEDIIVKQGSKFGIKISKNVGQAIPKILGYNTKFVLKILGAKYGGVFLKGAAGGISGVFDIVDIALSAQALKECSDRADTDNKCGDREVRDNIASITFSGVSFVTGIILIAAGAGGPLTIGIALGLMVSHGIYSGVSAIVEYEEKYDTTDDENWRIFWHNFALQSPPEDVQHLAARTAAVNNIVEKAWQDLASMPANVVAYAGGFGKITLKHFPKQCRTVLKYIEAAQGGGGQVYVDECSPAYTKPYLESSSAIIDMMWSSNDNNDVLSRVLPDHINNGATMTCLPRPTDAVYEKSGTSRSDSNVIYKCDNSFVIERDENHGTKYVFVNSILMNPGIILIGPNSLSGLFILNSNNIDINTFSQRNEFVFLSDKFPGTINIYNKDFVHIVNIFNTEQLLDEVVIFNIQTSPTKVKVRFPNRIIDISDISTDISIINISINGNPIKYKHIKLLQINDDLIQIQYHGRKNKEDHITCESPNNESDSINIFVDSGGGFNNQRQDIIKNCKKAIIWPYTKVEGGNGPYILYIKTAGYEKQNSSSEINITGKGTIIFPETALLKDCEDITYSEADNTISLRIKLGENIFYRLDIKNYLDKGSKVSNFNLIDKYGSNIVPKIEQSATIINKFELNIEKDIHDSDANDISVVKRYYRKISDKKINYELFGNVKYKEKYYRFGSDAKDIITLDKNTRFVQGGEAGDIYIASNDMDMGTIILDNGSRDKKLDVLMVQSVNDVSLVSRDDNLNILITKTKDHLVKIDNIIVRNYFLANWYRHLLLVDQEGKAFIPFFNTNKDLTLVPFYSCNIGNRFTIQTGAKVVLDCDLNKIEYYRDNNNLILFDKIMDHPIITMEQFFNNLLKWQIYHYRNTKEVALLKNDVLDYYIFEYFSSDIDIDNLRIEFTQLLNDTVVLSEEPLGKKGGIEFQIKNQWKGDNFVMHIKSGSSNISAMVKFVSELGDCNDKYLRFNQRDNDVILLQKCSNNKEANHVQVKIKDYVIARTNFLTNSKINSMVIDDCHTINTDVQSGASRAKDYKEKIKELYKKIFKEYKIDFSKFFEITHNQQTLANGTLIPISSDQERFGIIIFKKFIPYWVTLYQDGDDLNIYDRVRGKYIVIRNWFIDRKYTISRVEFDWGLEPITIHKWNKDTNMIIGHNKSARLLNKLRLAEEINKSKSTYLRDSSGDELHTLKCVTIVNNLNSTVKSYAALGFSSPEKQVNFVKKCKFTESSLEQLKTFMPQIAFYLCCSNPSNLVLPPPNMVNNRLALDVWYKLALSGYNYQQASEIYNSISKEFEFDKILENINKVQNALRNTPNEEVFQRHRRDVDDKFITSGANSISSPVNELLNWFKNKYHFIFNLVKAPNASEATEGFLGQEQGPRFKYNINDELANSNTHNLARSSTSILEPSFSFNNGLWSWVWNKLSNLSFKLLPEADAATLDNSKSFNDIFNDIYKLIKQFNNYPSDTQIEKQNHKTEAENNNIDNNENYNLYHNDIDNSKSSLSDYLLIDDPSNDQGNLQTVINSIDIPSNLSLLTLLIGQFFGTNKALSNNPYISPEQEKNRYINELNKTVKSAISEMETKYGKRQITNDELEDILPSLDILFNGQEELNYNNNSTSVLGKITEICNHVYDFLGYEAN